jgi:hypothetical protein
VPSTACLPHEHDETTHPNELGWHLCSLLMHFIGVNKVDSVRSTCTFKGWKVAL